MEELIKKLKEVKLYNPQDLKMVDNGHGEFPDVYALTQTGLEKIIKLIKE